MFAGSYASLTLILIYYEYRTVIQGRNLLHEVFILVNIHIAVFWVMTLCGLVGGIHVALFLGVDPNVNKSDCCRDNFSVTLTQPQKYVSVLD